MLRLLEVTANNDDKVATARRVSPDEVLLKWRDIDGTARQASVDIGTANAIVSVLNYVVPERIDYAHEVERSKAANPFAFIGQALRGASDNG